MFAALLAGLLAGPANGAPPALEGLDPLSILAGQPVPGQAAHQAAVNGRLYWFETAAARDRFVAAPSDYLFENRVCPVMPGVRASGAVWSVHDGRILLFGSTHCRAAFLAAPDTHAGPAPGGWLQQTSVVVPAGDLRLQAWWMRPAHWNQQHAAVIVHGSGAVSRDHPWTMEVARLLVAQGMAVLLADKRGCGRSDGDWRQADFEALAADAGAARAWVMQRAPGTAVGYVGLSQGGAVAPLAAVRHGGDFVVSLSSAATPYLQTAWHQYLNAIHGADLSTEDRNEALAIHTLLEQAVRSGDGVARDAYLQRFAAGQSNPALARFLQGLPDTAGHWRWPWLAKVVGQDPLDAWRALSVPGLVVHGRLDELSHLPVHASRQRLAQLPRPPTMQVFDDLGHDLRSGHAVSPAVGAFIGRWLTEQAERLSGGSAPPARPPRHRTVPDSGG